MSDMYVAPGSEGVTPAIDITPKAPEIPKVADEKDYGAIKAGTQYTDPEGKTRYKPISSAKDYEALDEGAEYADPEGKIRTKPKFEPIDFTAQTLYDMSVTPSEKKKALERSYPGKVKEDRDGLYIEDAGKYRRPGRGAQAAGGFAAAAAAPVVGAVLGSIGGGVAGSAMPGAGTFAGGVAGAASGGILGQGINDLVLQLAGVYDRTSVEEAANLGKAGMMSVAGSGVGRGIAAMVPAAKAGVSSVGQMLPTLAAKFLGAGPELTTARELAEKGVKVPPSAWAHEAPHLQNVVEVFDPAFRTNKPLLESATKHYEDSAQKVLDDLGVKPFEGSIKPRDSIVHPTADVPTVPAGELVLQKTLAESAQKDAALAAALEQRKAALSSGVPEKLAQREAVTQAAEKSRQAAQQLIDAGFASIQKEAEQAAKLAGSGASTGDLWENIGNKLAAVRRGVGERATKMYSEADQLAGGHLPDSSGLAPIAKDFLEQLPTEFKSKYPDIVQKLESLAGKVDPKTGEVIKEASQPTFGQLHNLRSILRGNADWWTLSSDIRNGTYKYFSKAVDDVLHEGMRAKPSAIAGSRTSSGVFVSNEERPAWDYLKKIGKTDRQIEIESPEFGGVIDMASKLGHRPMGGNVVSIPRASGLYEQTAPIDGRTQALKLAAEQLDRADKFYKDNIPIFEANQIKAVMKGLEAGEPADPTNLYKVLVKEGQTDLTNRVKQMVGPNLWAGVEAADTQAMLNASKTLNPGEINGRGFAKEVLDRHQRGMLEIVHGKDKANALLAQARSIEQLEGRLPIPVKPDDTMTQVVARARLAAEEAKAQGTRDPLTALQKDIKRVEAETKREASLERRNDPLGFLYNKSTGASYAVDKILGDEDLILAAAARFGEKSPEFNALRQVYVERVLRSTLEPGKRLEKISPEVQQIMFPGVTKSQMDTLAKEMNLLMDTRANLRGDTAGGMSAMSKVENPLTKVPVAKGIVKLIPGANPAARATLGKYYSLVTQLMTSPSTLRWIEKGLTRGTPEEQEAVRNILRRHLQKGGAMGAGAGEAVYQGSDQ